MEDARDRMVRLLGRAWDRASSPLYRNAFFLMITSVVGNGLDRKSTRMNSRHSQISYAVLCLKKKRLREYRAGDEFRHISWSATARRVKLITKVHQSERIQILWLDHDPRCLIHPRVKARSHL